MDEPYFPELSEREVADLGAQFGIDVHDGELEALGESVNNWLSDLDRVYDLPVAERSERGERSWWEPDEDPHRAIAHWCDVGPTPDHGDLLDGYTVGLKDNIVVASVPLTCGSQVMKGFVPDTDATCVQRLREAGATITAKTNLSEFAAVLLSAHRRPVTNPHDPDRHAGSTSSGSAVAVATEMVDVALGTDTGGSVRVPASWCGVVGHKPTYGLVSLNGVVENTYTQDHVGQFGRSVADVARTLEAVAGRDESDPASLQAAGREDYRVGGYVKAAEQPPALADLTVGVLEEGSGEGVHRRVETTVDDVLDTLADAGATVERVSVPEAEFAKPIKATLSLVELATHWRDGGAAYRRGGVVAESYQVSLANRMRAASGELQDPYKSKLLAGAQLVLGHSGRHYTRAQAARETVREAMEDALDSVDVLAFPTVADIAPTMADIRDFDSLEFDIGRNTRLADVTRQPAVTVPAGTAEEMPVGLQLMGPAFRDDDLLGAAAAVEGALE